MAEWLVSGAVPTRQGFCLLSQERKMVLPGRLWRRWVQGKDCVCNGKAGLGAGTGIQDPDGEWAGVGSRTSLCFPYLVVVPCELRFCSGHPSQGASDCKRQKPSRGALRGILDRVCPGPTDSFSHLLRTAEPFMSVPLSFWSPQRAARS